MYYEQLRDSIVQPHCPGGRGLGWALFVRKGMAAWFEAWHQNVLHEAPDLMPPRSESVLPDQRQQDEIVVVWTGMVMSHVSEAMG